MPLRVSLPYLKSETWGTLVYGHAVDRLPDACFVWCERKVLSGEGAVGVEGLVGEALDLEGAIA